MAGRLTEILSGIASGISKPFKDIKQGRAMGNQLYYLYEYFHFGIGKKFKRWTPEFYDEQDSVWEKIEKLKQRGGSLGYLGKVAFEFASD